MSEKRGKRVLKNAMLMTGAKGLGAVFALAGLAFAARGLTTEEFGLLVFIHAFVLFFTEVATFESWLVVVRHAAHGAVGDRAGREDPRWFGRIVRFCVTLDLTAAIIAFTIAMIALAVLRGQLEIVEKAAPYLIAYATLILLNQKSASLGVLRLFNRYDLLALNSLIIPFGRLAGCGVAWALDLPLAAYVAAWWLASAVSYLGVPVWCLRELRRRDMWRPVKGGGLSLRAPAKGYWRLIALTNIDTAIAAGSAQLPVLLAGAVGGAGYAAIFRVAQEVAIVLSKGAKMIDKVVFPEFTDLIARGEGPKVPGLVRRTGAMLLGVGALVGVSFWFVGPYLLSAALGPAYGGAGYLAVMLICGAALEAAAASAFPALYAAGHPGRAIMARAAGVATMAGCFLIFYSSFGDNGPGAAVILGALLTFCLIAIFVARVDWSHSRFQKVIRRSREAAASASTDDPSDGGPGQPGSSSS